ncbi:hypothetical protein BB561_002785 [Smittium simulii]|uniref:Uncharacterized protein n=1 Tax=Smittium simulii TaxID=133385 RepID=A0A2T9YP73_9FUNG|nr:hypothetical protein BB561_002785 [Smittium simulii]
MWAYIAYKLYLLFGWEMYKRIGANLHIREIYKEYLILIQLLKFDYFVITAFAFQYIFLILKSNDAELPITIAFVPISLTILFTSYYALKRENIPLMWTFIVGLIVFIGYYVFKVVRMYDPLQKAKYDKLKPILTYFAAVSLTLLLSTVFQAITCLTNFNQGLVKQIILIEGKTPESLLSGPRFYINSAGQRRMALEEYN